MNMDFGIDSNNDQADIQQRYEESCHRKPDQLCSTHLGFVLLLLLFVDLLLYYMMRPHNTYVPPLLTFACWESFP